MNGLRALVQAKVLVDRMPTPPEPNDEREEAERRLAVASTEARRRFWQRQWAVRHRTR